MNGQNRAGLALRFALCSLLVAGGGMVSRAYAADQAKPTVVVSLSQLNNDISILRSHLATTIAALEQLKATAANRGDLTKPYTAFSDSLGTLEAHVAMLRERGVAARARADEHWKAWQVELTSMQNPQLREKAQRRQTSTVKEFEKVVDRVEAAKKVFAPLMADLKDVNTYLKTDLSQQAVSSLSGTIWNMSQTARSADAKLVDVSEQITRTIKKMPQA